MVLVEKNKEFALWDMGDYFKLSIFYLGSYKIENSQKAATLLMFARFLYAQNTPKPIIRLYLKHIALYAKPLFF